ncbi:MAG TPA: hypothetical protein VMB18_09815 [Terriglobales bacterium]|nr:hypothetical protein [Terriglobales bacterium]
MATSVGPLPNHGWKGLYVAALLEGDEEKIPNLINAAEHAIGLRTQELLRAEGDHWEEQQDLDDAAYALHALKTCLVVHGRFAEAA